MKCFIHQSWMYKGSKSLATCFMHEVSNATELKSQPLPSTTAVEQQILTPVVTNSNINILNFGLFPELHLGKIVP